MMGLTRSSTASPTMYGAQFASAVFILSLATFMAVLDTTIVNVAVPHIAGAFAATPHEGTWTITSYAVAEAFTVPLSGWLAKRFGAVRVFIVSVIGFAVFSVLCGLATSLTLLVIFRVLQGLTGGPLIPMSQILILRIAPPDKAELATGLWMMTTILAPIAGPILGGTLADTIGWRWAFYINVPVSMLCAVWAWYLLRDRENETAIERVDYVGLVLLALWVGAFQIMLDTGENADWFSSAWVTSLAVIAAIGFVVFIIWELTDENPVVDLRVFKHRGFWVSAAAMTLTFGAFFASIVLLPLWLQISMGYTATLSGYVLSFQGIFGVIVAPIVALLMCRVDPRALMSVGLGIVAFSILYRAGFTSQISFQQMILPQLAMGLGIPFFFVPLMALSIASVKPSETASASGLINFLRTLASAAATAIVVSAWKTETAETRASLVGTLQPSTSVYDRSAAAGLSPDQALHSIDAMVQQQSIMLATNHLFLILGLIIAFTAVGIWLMPKQKLTGQPAAAH